MGKLMDDDCEHCWDWRDGYRCCYCNQIKIVDPEEG